MSNKYRLYSSNKLNNDVAWDTDASFSFPTDLTIRKIGNLEGTTQMGSTYFTPKIAPINRIPNKRKYYLEEDTKTDYIIFIFSKKYPVNIEFRIENNIIQDFDPNIPNLQFLEDILIKGSKLKRIDKKELRIDNDESKLTDFEISFWNFLQNNVYKSFRDYILNSRISKVPNSKSAVTKELYLEDGISGYQILNVLFSQNNFINLPGKYKFELIFGTIKSESTSIDKFDYNTSIKLLKPEYSKHFINYWNPILLDDNNILCLYNNRYIEKNYLLTNHPDWKSTWKPEIDYKLDDVVSHLNGYFQCLIDHTSGLNFSYTSWKELSYIPNTSWDNPIISKFTYIKYKNEFFLAKENNSFSQEPPGGSWLQLALGNTNFLEDTTLSQYTRNIEQFAFVHFNNLFPDVIEYNNPLLIKLISGYNTMDYSSELEYQFQYDTDKPNRMGNFTTYVDNPSICFTDLTGILRYINGKLLFCPSTKVYDITIVNYNIDTNITTININVNSSNIVVERIIPGITEKSVNLSGQLYISDNFSLYVYLEEPLN